MHDKQICERAFTNMKKKKTYKLPSGKEILFQGYGN